MIDLNPIATLRSQIIPGAEFDIEVISHRTRQSVNFECSEDYAKIREFSLEYVENMPLSSDPADVAEQKTARRVQASKAVDRVMDRRIKETYVSRCVKVIRGFTVCGQAPTVQDLNESLPMAVFDEVYEFIQNHKGLTPDEQKNSQSPLPLQTAGDGGTSSTDVPSAKTADSTEPVAA